MNQTWLELNLNDPPDPGHSSKTIEPGREVNYDVRHRELKYYIFDWDDNILRMPTYIHLERLQPDGTWIPNRVTTSTFAIIRNDSAQYRPPANDWEKAFVEFRDFDSDDESKFLKDTRTALARIRSGREKPAPSFDTFRKVLVEGRIFAIVTARGHRKETLRKGVELCMEEMLSPAEKHTMLSNLRGYLACFQNELDESRMSNPEVLQYYMALNHYHAVTSPQFRRKIAQIMPDVPSPETRKQLAISHFLEHLFDILERMEARKPVSVGFSDDDPVNVQAVEDYIRSVLSQRFPAVRFVVYDTSDPRLKKGRKSVVSGQLDLGII